MDDPTCEPSDQLRADQAFGDMEIELVGQASRKDLVNIGWHFRGGDGVGLLGRRDDER